MNNLIALTSPQHPGVFRISFETDPPEVVLHRISTESISPIIIYRTREVPVNQDVQDSCANMIDIFCTPVRSGSQWRYIDPKRVDRIFDTHQNAPEPPPFLEHMSADEDRSASTGSDCKIDEANESEEDTPVIVAPGGIKVPSNAMYHAPTSRGHLRNLWEFIPDGARIWHAKHTCICQDEKMVVKHDAGWYGRYDLSSNTIVCDADNKKYSSITAFTTAHYLLHNREKQNGWTSCKYWVNGEWRDIDKVKSK